MIPSICDERLVRLRMLLVAAQRVRASQSFQGVDSYMGKRPFEGGKSNGRSRVLMGVIA
jgi:hypothetical protein